MSGANGTNGTNGNGKKPVGGGVPRGTEKKRPKDWFRRRCEKLISSRKWKTEVKSVLEDKDHPAFMAMSRLIVEQSQGRPPASKVAEDIANSLEELVAGAYDKAKAARKAQSGPQLVKDDALNKTA